MMKFATNAITGEFFFQFHLNLDVHNFKNISLNANFLNETNY